MVSKTIDYGSNPYQDAFMSTCTVCSSPLSKRTIRRAGKYCSRDCYMKDRKVNVETNPNYKDGHGVTNYGCQVAYRERSRHKRNARSRVEKALKRGKLIKEPCFKCGNENTEAHHEDYDKPLEVIWLCKQCHSALHYPAN